MNAELTVYSSNTTRTTTLNNVLVEEYPDGIMFSADKFVYTIPCSEINATESLEDRTTYFLNNHKRVVVNWLD